MHTASKMYLRLTCLVLCELRLKAMLEFAQRISIEIVKRERVCICYIGQCGFFRNRGLLFLKITFPNSLLAELILPFQSEECFFVCVERKWRVSIVCTPPASSEFNLCVCSIPSLVHEGVYSRYEWILFRFSWYFHVQFSNVRVSYQWRIYVAILPYTQSSRPF